MLSRDIEYTKHAIKRMKERGLYNKQTDQVVRVALKKVYTILSEKSLEFKHGNLSIVAAKHGRPVVVTVWRND